MIKSKYNWKCQQPDRQKAEELAGQMNISVILASLLINRGMADAEFAEKFMRGGSGELHDPFLLSGMQEAVPRILHAIAAGERILIYGDYDADGVSSTSLMIRLMRHLGADFDYYIPHRSKEGYGLHNHALDLAREKGTSLIITVDTGISAVSQIAYANELGMDVIVTDHHEPPSELPQAYALINPKLSHCPYPFKGLAGVGVAYKLASALIGEVPEEWLQLVALGTIADLMPLMDENRVLVSRGLKSMDKEALIGAAALLRIAGGSDKGVNSTTIGFSMAPRINASGRLSHASRAVSLLTTEDLDEADEIASELDLLNRERQQMVEDIVQQAVSQLEAASSEGKQIPSVIVIAGEGWNVGVVGIVASKILERYYRPTIILAVNPETGECKGSARSIPGFDMYEALTECADLMHHYGGHTAAAGMSLHRDNLAAFEERLNKYAAQVLEPEHFVPVLSADLECSLNEITIPLIQELERLAPFGMENSCPRLLIRGAELMETRTMGREGNHLKLTLRQNGAVVEAVAFGKGVLGTFITEGARVDLVVEASINEWNGSVKPQLMIQDLSVSHLQVFDFRSCPSPFKIMDDFATKLRQLPSGQTARTAVVCRQSSAERYRPDLVDSLLWVYDEEAGLHESGMRPGLAVDDLSQITSLFILELPEYSAQLDSVLTSIPNLERIILVHGQQDRYERVEIPSRDNFKTVYAWIRHYSAKGLTEEQMLNQLVRQTGFTKRMMRLTLEVFEELEFIIRDNGRLRLNPSPSKQPLETSARYLQLEALAEMEQVMLRGKAAQVAEWMRSRTAAVS
ncbi:single-stranded-DNA-specific exonuclease RecJ [Paenibacillus sp. J22TS3]|uniref:single-stranded-DNA-specific exonuclease RecJ n=1 Tax=Paenibacillus sp. J22TS3 TaxID=2807192 RepID=UPI001B299C83|nr:single-stranded-DNA-specific exonuclease RecJ [Paenibacillus sp. J22TS3]GIP20800.1 single-stranded-DNA-specific exonuclease RecJ [Paenibacillus sp. J22TS3]